MLLYFLPVCTDYQHLPSQQLVTSSPVINWVPTSALPSAQAHTLCYYFSRKRFVSIHFSSFLTSGSKSERLRTLRYRVKFVVKFHGFHNVPQKTVSLDTRDVLSRVIVSHVHGCCQLRMTQSFHSGVTMRAPVSLLLSQFPVYIFLGLFLIAFPSFYEDFLFHFLTYAFVFS